jgi:hypothetical protein
MAESSDTMDMKEFQLHEKDTGSADVQVARTFDPPDRSAHGTPQESRQRSFVASRSPQDGRYASQPARLLEPVEKRSLQDSDREAEFAEVIPLQISGVARVFVRRRRHARNQTTTATRPLVHLEFRF